MILGKKIKRNGKVDVLFHSINGEYIVSNQLYIKGDGSRSSFLREIGGVYGGRYSSELDARICKWANVVPFSASSYMLLESTGSRQLSGNGVEQYVLQRAVGISLDWLSESVLLNCTEEEEEKKDTVLKVKEIDIYSATSEEIEIQLDEVCVNAQKPHKKIERVEGDAKRIYTTVALVRDKSGGYHTLTEGINSRGDIIYPISQAIRDRVIEVHGKKEELPILAITDGARHLRLCLEEIFGSSVCIVLDWYHLCLKIKSLMSMIATNKKDKAIYINDLTQFLWRGDVASALEYLATIQSIKNQEKYEELFGYISKHQKEIIDYEKRQMAGKTIGSGRCEKANDLVVAHRQKKKGMAWSKKGSKALAIIKVFFDYQKKTA